MTLMSLENVSFSYRNDRAILEDVALDITAGDTVGLVGESGSGKTTLLRLMLGLAQPDAGRILFDGSPLDPGNRAFKVGS